VEISGVAKIWALCGLWPHPHWTGVLSSMEFVVWPWLVLWQNLQRFIFYWRL